MARGVIAGVVAGVVVSVLGLGTASLMMGPVDSDLSGARTPAVAAPQSPTPPAAGESPGPVAEPVPAPVVEPLVDESADAGDGTVPEVPEGEGAGDVAPTPLGDAEETSDAPGQDASDAMPADAAGAEAASPDEEITDADGGVAEPAAQDEALAALTPGQTEQPASGADERVEPEQEAEAVPEPASGPEPDFAPGPVDEAEPEAETGLASEPGSGAEPELSVESELALAPEPDAVAEPETAPVADPEPMPVPQAMPDVERTPEPLPAPEPETAPQPEPALEPGATADPDPLETPAPEPRDIPASEPEPLPMIVVEPEPGMAGEEIIDVTPEAELTPSQEAAGAVVTGRLPRIGDEPAEIEQPVIAEPALTRNAVPFAATGDQPLLAFLLLDVGADRDRLGDLGALPFPVTVAVDVSAADAAETMRFYREQGAEIALTVPLPAAATASDIDVTMEAYGPLLAGAAAVVMAEDDEFQSLGEAAVQLAVNLAETGHGLVSYPSGLNTGHKAALKEGVRAGLVFRDLDGDGQDGAVIRRFLDNAAFRARNEDGVIVVARARAETLQAILEWSLGTRAQSVAVAPVSAVLDGT